MENHKVKENKDLVRDPYSGAIINSNRTAYLEAVAAHKKATASSNRINALETQVSDLHNKIDTIINMMASGSINKTED
jgi:polyhydroxyalkanoate synthesis regulator phasin